MSSLTSLPAWAALREHHARISSLHLNGLFEADADRFSTLSVSLPGFLADFSKNRITPETVSLLARLAQEAEFGPKRRALFDGKKINTSENRAVLHTALRGAAAENITVDGEDVIPFIQAVLGDMEAFCHAVRSGGRTGYTGKPFTDIVNIGIGGSSLGPQMAAQALSAFRHPRLRLHFAANVEASDLGGILQSADPETTLFIVASKTFTTAETMQNATVARDWFLRQAGSAAHVSRHFVAVSTNRAAVESFGIAPENMFPFRDWVGGRYSIWSSIGLAVMLAIGPEHFRAFLSGAREMDSHFQSAPLEKNIPFLMGAIGLWYRNFFNWPIYACIPYHSALARLPAWLQQLDMESNGKSVTATGAPAGCATGPAVFGEPGTDAQHSFFQWLHQGSDIVPVDFIAAIKASAGTQAQQRMLLANCLAQSEALMTGKSNTQEPHRHFVGNRPSTTFLLDALEPRTLGMLLAAYEHKVFVQGALWGINSFDQWGVELGKVMAKTLEAEIGAKDTGAHDGSTQGLMGYIIHNAIT